MLVGRVVVADVAELVRPVVVLAVRPVAPEREVVASAVRPVDAERVVVALAGRVVVALAERLVVALAGRAVAAERVAAVWRLSNVRPANALD